MGVHIDFFFIECLFNDLIGWLISVAVSYGSVV